MMKMMKMMVLLLSWFLCVSADYLHDVTYTYGCSDSDSDGEFMLGLDGEQVYYTDFKNKRDVYPHPDFVCLDNPLMEGAYLRGVTELQICRTRLDKAREAHRDVSLKFDAPSTPIIYPRDKVELRVKNVLICHVTGFYPAPVNVTWTKNGEKVTEGTSISVPYPNKDITYRQFSRLDFIPQQGDIYSCTVQHPALSQPLTRIWDVEKTLPSVGPAVFCGLGLTVGLLGVAAGTFLLVKGNECS